MNNLGRYTLYIQNITDVISLTLAFFVSRFIRFTFIQYTGYTPDAYWRFYMSVILAYVVVDIFVLCRENLLDRKASSEFFSIVKMIVYIFSMVLVFTYITKTSAVYSRIFFTIYAAVSILFIFIGRSFVKAKFFPMYQKSKQSRKIVLVGPFKKVKKAVEVIKDSDDWRFNISGLVVIDENIKGDYINNIEVISDLGHMSQDIAVNDTDSVYIVPDYIDDRVVEWTKRFCEAGKNVYINMDDFGGLTEYTRVTDQIAGNNVMSYLPVLPVPRRQAIIKRIFDIVLSLLLIPVFFIVGFFVFVFTKIESNGPVLLSRIRISKNGRRYYQYRFRMLRMDAKERMKEKKTPFTIMGMILRITHLDGLPMIWNVLSGDMSFVGPHSPRLTSYLNYESDRRKNLCVRAGVVGYWSVENNLSQITVDERDYIENWTFIKDLNILFRMIGHYITFSSSKTYSKKAFQEELAMIQDANEFKTPLAYATRESLKEDSTFYKGVKRAFDFVSSFIAIVLLSPILLILSILVIADDGGSPFYGHTRIGKNGKRIMVYKFRSMRKDAGDLERLLTPEQLIQYKTEFKIDDDPRITKIGEFLRKTSLDELPQLFNILSGDLSIVGPRPIVEKETEIYGEDIDKLLSVKPGLTGYWQAYARNNATYESGERQQMEMYYVDNRSIWLDIKIIFKTFISVLKREGAQ